MPATYLITIEHTPAGPVVRVADGMPREMMIVILGAVAREYLDGQGVGDGAEVPALLEHAARFVRDNPDAFELVRDESLIVVPRGPF